jgi:competence protein ComGC
MKKRMTSIAGVTLLEILLVLAIAAMILVLSIRYYQSAKSSQDQASLMAMITAISAGSDSFSVGKNNYKGLTLVKIKSLLPATLQETPALDPWGGTISVTGSADGKKYTATFPGVAASVCTIVEARLAANKHFDAIKCSNNAGLEYSYLYSIT